MFVDFTKVFVKSGSGGKGCVAFRHEKHVPKGGPSGGDGGNGGDVVIKAVPNLHTLQDVKYHKSYKAKKGKPGLGSCKFGKNGNSVVIPVPPGTVVIDETSGKILADLVKIEQSIIVAHGGKGGRGNASFATPTNRAPRYAEDGISGEEKVLIFELKILSDVGLVGLPNSGKSTLISKLTLARPKIADYPFTTLIPNLGIVKYGEYRSFVMADIPGLIKGAHKGKGLGHRFLRHLERTRVLAFLIESIDPDPVATYKLLDSELECHFSGFKDRQRIIVLTKDDLVENPPNVDINGIEVISISAVVGTGLETFVNKIVKFLQ